MNEADIESSIFFSKQHAMSLLLRPRASIYFMVMLIITGSFFFDYTQCCALLCSFGSVSIWSVSAMQVLWNWWNPFLCGDYVHPSKETLNCITLRLIIMDCQKRNVNPFKEISGGGRNSLWLNVDNQRRRWRGPEKALTRPPILWFPDRP